MEDNKSLRQQIIELLQSRPNYNFAVNKSIMLYNPEDEEDEEIVSVSYYSLTGLPYVSFEGGLCIDIEDLSTNNIERLSKELLYL